MHQIVVIGAGRIGRIHARNVALHPRLCLAGVADAVADSAAQVAAACASQVVDADAALADPGIDGVVIASSTDTHLDYCLRAAAAGKAVFCEKPIDQDLARARRQ